jgi:general secretion pathway protein G
MTPTLTQYLELTQSTVLSHNIKSLQQAVDIYYLEEGTYPYNLHELVEIGYFRQLPVNPYTGSVDYIYNPYTGAAKEKLSSNEF